MERCTLVCSGEIIRGELQSFERGTAKSHHDFSWFHKVLHEVRPIRYTKIVKSNSIVANSCQLMWNICGFLS